MPGWAAAEGGWGADEKGDWGPLAPLPSEGPSPDLLSPWMDKETKLPAKSGNFPTKVN